jgi:hypothetical protein
MFFFQVGLNMSLRCHMSPMKMQHIPIQGEKCVQVSRMATQATF